MDALKVQAELTSSGDKLDFIFEAIRLAQEKARNLDNNLASALQLQVSSDVISYNMLGPSSNLLAKLAVKGVSFQWTNRKDSSTSNVLTIKDFQAFNGLPGATFPEILVAHPQPSSHPMVKVRPSRNLKQALSHPLSSENYLRKRNGQSCRPSHRSRLSSGSSCVFTRSKSRSRERSAERSKSTSHPRKDGRERWGTCR